MKTTLLITSKANERVKHLKKLLIDRKYRYREEEYVIEGIRALDDIKNIKALFVRENTEIPDINCRQVYIVNEKVFDYISDTENSQGVIAVSALNISGSDSLSKRGRYILLDRIQDPGNMGSVIRTGCAFDLDGVIITPGCVDPFSPKVVRAAASSMEKINIIRMGNIAGLKDFNLIAADLTGQDVSSFKWPDGFILAIGNEANGLCEEVKSVAKSIITIPASGRIESLNAAVSAGIILYAHAVL